MEETVFASGNISKLLRIIDGKSVMVLYVGNQDWSDRIQGYNDKDDIIKRWRNEKKIQVTRKK